TEVRREMTAGLRYRSQQEGAQLAHELRQLTAVELAHVRRRIDSFEQRVAVHRISSEGPPRATGPPPGGQRARRAWGDLHPGEGPPRATGPPPGGQRARRAWGDLHPGEGPPRATGPPPRGQRAHRA